MEVLTFSEFCARRRYDVNMSHDRLRFPHGISKRQERDNRRAANHHWQEFCRASRDYFAAIAANEVRPPTDAEERIARLGGHVDSESVRATWRVSVKAWLRRNPGSTAQDAVAGLLDAHFGGMDPWATELGLAEEYSKDEAVAARVAWLNAQPAPVA